MACVLYVMCFILVVIVSIEVFLGVMMSRKRLTTAASSRVQETKETVIDAQHIEAVAQVHMCGALWIV